MGHFVIIFLGLVPIIIIFIKFFFVLSIALRFMDFFDIFIILTALGGRVGACGGVTGNTTGALVAGTGKVVGVFVPKRSVVGT